MLLFFLQRSRPGTSLAITRVTDDETWIRKEKAMRAIQHTITGRTKGESSSSVLHRLAEIASRLSEPFWLCISFLLFIAMGPFSVIAVVYGLWSLANGEHREKMIEPASC